MSVGFGACGYYRRNEYAEQKYAKPDNKAGSKKVNKAWLHDHINDPYVKLANKEGYRARAAYKLKEIDETLHLVKPGQLVVDLGCTPGAWSQYLRRRMSPKGAAVGSMNGTIIGLDLCCPWSPLKALPSFRATSGKPTPWPSWRQRCNGRQADLVVSDMAPNLSGISSADAARVEYLVELAIEFAQNHMKPQGARWSPRCSMAAVTTRLCSTSSKRL